MLQDGVVREAVATDISPGMLDTLQANAERIGVEVETVACNTEQLPFEDGSFDLVLGHAVLHHIPHLDRAFAEFLRVLKPGGEFLFSGEPSQTGDRIAAYPKRAALATAPLWRVLMRPARPRATTPPMATATGRRSTATSTARRSSRSSTCTPSPPTRSAPGPAAPASRTSACAARSCSPTGSAG